MKRVYAVFLIAVIACCSSCVMAGQARVSLKAQARVKPEGMVKLCDIATIQGSAAQKRAIGEVVVLIAPRPGNMKIIEAEYVQRKLESVRIKDVRMEGASEVAIEGDCIRIEPSDLLEQAKAYLTAALPAITSGAYNITAMQEPEELVIPVGTKLEMLPRLMFNEARVGVNYILLDAKVDGKTVGTARISLKAAVMVDALVASSTIRRGETINGGNTSLRQMEAVKGREYLGAEILSCQEPVVSSRTIMPGSAICSSDVTSQLAVKKGDVVTLVVRCGNVKLATAAEVKEDGRRGQSVAVRSDVSTSDLRATVIEPGLVEIKR